jgi:hypothetical protein
MTHKCAGRPALLTTAERFTPTQIAKSTINYDHRRDLVR